MNNQRKNIIPIIKMRRPDEPDDASGGLTCKLEAECC